LEHVFGEESLPPEAFLDRSIYDEDTAVAAADKVIELFERLQPHVGRP
jgi:hypothetical protein